MVLYIYTYTRIGGEMKGLYIFDTEGDNLFPAITKFHVLAFKEYRKDNWNVFLDKKHPEYAEAVEYCSSVRGENITIHNMDGFNNWIVNDKSINAIACHNMFGFDLPAMNKLLGTKHDYFPQSINGREIRLFDTLTMSQVLYPDRPLPNGCPSKVYCPVTGKMKTVGSHGLAAWGYRVNNAKPQVDDWRDQPLCTYINRVLEDVIINEGTWTLLIEEISSTEPKFKVDWKVALQRSMATDYLMRLQELQGVCFDVVGAEALKDRIDMMQEELEREVEPQLPERMLPKSQQPKFPAVPFKSDGTISSDGIRWLKRLGYEFDEEVLNTIPPPKTAFKGDGSLSKAGINYCTRLGVEDEEKMEDFIRYQLQVVNKPIFKGGVEAENKARQDLETRKMPILTEPMRMSNQADIKKYLVESEGWRPTIMGTIKGFDVDERKRKLPDSVLTSKIKDYIQMVYESPYKEFIYDDLGFNFENFKEEATLIERLKKKARYLPSTPKLKDERGNLCPALELLKGDMAKAIVKWLSLRNRRSVIQTKDEGKSTGWLNNDRLHLDGKLSAAYTGLTNTHRRKHAVVNFKLHT